MHKNEHDSEFTWPQRPNEPDLGVVGIKNKAVEAASSVGDLYQVSHGYLERQASTRPYVLLGTALGLGFVLGGGLASRLAGMLLVAGGRILTSELMEASLNKRAQSEAHSELVDA